MFGGPTHTPPSPELVPSRATLADQFAMQAMVGLINVYGNDTAVSDKMIAETSYSMAKRMMEAREKYYKEMQ